MDGDGETLLIRLNVEGVLLPGPVGDRVGLIINSVKLDEAYNRNRRGNLHITNTFTSNFVLLDDCTAYLI